MRMFCCLSILAGFLLPVVGCRSNSSSAPSQSNVGPGQIKRSGPDFNADAGPRAPVPDVNPTDDKRPVLVCFGDSETAGRGTDRGQSYPDFLQADLDRLGYRYRVVNQGISGDTTKDGVERLPKILELHAAVVVVEFGGNDGLRGLRIEDTRTNLDKIVSTIKASGAKVALAGITLPPDYGPDYIRQFNETYTLLAGKYHVPLLPFLLKDVYGVPGQMQEDGIHATASGNKVVARNVQSLVLPLLKK